MAGCLNKDCTNHTENALLCCSVDCFDYIMRLSIPKPRKYPKCADCQHCIVRVTQIGTVGMCDRASCRESITAWPVSTKIARTTGNCTAAGFYFTPKKELLV